MPNEELLLKDGDGETLTTLAASIGENFLAAAGGHTCAKSVGSEPAKIVGLVRPFHRKFLLFSWTKGESFGGVP